MIKAIIFDCFGVLTSDGWSPFREKYFGDDEEKYAEATRLNHLSDSGKLPFKDLVSMISKMAGASYGETERAFHTNVPNESIFEIITQLKEKYTIGLLSNVANNWLEELFTPEQLALFDGYALSGEMGFAKPDPRAFLTIAERLGAHPTECVFIDDQPAYTTAAESVGMQAVHFQNNSQLQRELDSLLAANSDK